jgi:hypothetical protein
VMIISESFFNITTTTISVLFYTIDNIQHICRVQPIAVRSPNGCQEKRLIRLNSIYTVCVAFNMYVGLKIISFHHIRPADILLCIYFRTCTHL